jgi:hypothetical protein
MRSSILLLILLTITTPLAWGQQKDFGTWSYFNFQYKISEKWSVGYADHQLTHENASERWMFFHDFSIQQKINSHFNHEFHYRLVQFQKLNDVLEDRTLFYYALNGNWNVNDWTFSARSRWQSLAYGNHWSDSYKGPYQYHRLKISIGKRINYHWKCNIGTELFQPLNHPGRSGIDQWRIGPELSYKYNKFWSLILFYQIQKQLQRQNPYTYYLVGTGINLTL